MTTTTTNAPFEMQTLAIYSHKCALVMRMVDVAVRSTPEGWRNLVTTHGLNLTKEQAEQHLMRYDSEVFHVGSGWYEVILDEKKQESLGLLSVPLVNREFVCGDDCNWIQVYVAPKGGAL